MKKDPDGSPGLFYFQVICVNICEIVTSVSRNSLNICTVSVVPVIRLYPLNSLVLPDSDQQHPCRCRRIWNGI